MPPSQRAPAPRFLILLCAHNGAAHLPVQLQSLTCQTYPAHAIEIHDWASSDATRDILRSYAAASADATQICLRFHDEAPGPSISFLRALRSVLAQPQDFDYLLFCDQDDVWDEQKLEQFAKVVQRNPQLDLIYSDVSLIDAQGREIAGSYLGPGGEFGRPMDMLHPSALFVNVVSGMSMGMSRRFLEQGQLAWSRDEWVMHDWAMCIWACLTGAHVQFLPLSLVGYRQHAANQLGGVGPHRATLPPTTLWRRARADVHRVQRQFDMCASLPARLPLAGLSPRVGRWAVALTILRGRTFAWPKALKVALVYWLFWRR
jgi:glycosyltransferase involved in cell wall biosynthesis